MNMIFDATNFVHATLSCLAGVGFVYARMRWRGPLAARTWNRVYGEEIEMDWRSANV